MPDFQYCRILFFGHSVETLWISLCFNCITALVCQLYIIFLQFFIDCPFIDDIVVFLHLIEDELFFYRIAIIMIWFSIKIYKIGVALGYKHLCCDFELTLFVMTCFVYCMFSCEFHIKVRLHYLFQVIVDHVLVYCSTSSHNSCCNLLFEGPEKELLQLGVFGELLALFSGVQIHMDLVGPAVPQFRLVF